MSSEPYPVIIESAIVAGGEGILDTSIVLRDLGHEYVVHHRSYELVDDRTVQSHFWGQYFRYDDPDTQHAALVAALAAWEETAKRLVS